MVVWLLHGRYRPQIIIQPIGNNNNIHVNCDQFLNVTKYFCPVSLGLKCFRKLGNIAFLDNKPELYLENDAERCILKIDPIIRCLPIFKKSILKWINTRCELCWQPKNCKIFNKKVNSNIFYGAISYKNQNMIFFNL